MKCGLKPRLISRKCSQSLALFLIFTGLVTGLAFAQQPAPPAGKTPPTAQTPPAGDQNINEDLRIAADLSGAFEHVADLIRPSVVNIESVKQVQVSQRLPRELREFFGGDLLGKIAPDRKETEEGVGSGLVISADGLILTNSHVVQGAQQVQVTMPAPDDRQLVADVVGTDPLTDLAVIKVNATDLHPAKLGDSARLRTGEWVLAVGNPFGLNSTMTAGIVSATGRANVGIASYEDFIQTDAAINPGNSGGPLVNLRGEVVGITTAIFSRSGGYMGIGFAIPSNMAEKIVPQLISQGRVVRGSMGVAIQNLTLGLARSFGFDTTKGVLIADVTPGSPADKAGLHRGDIVVSYGGQPTVKKGELRGMVADTKPGTRVPVEIFRDGKTVPLEVVVGELSQKVETAKYEEKAPAGSQMKMGITVHDLTPEIAREAEMPTDLHGVIITRVEPLSPADRGGLSVKDVIVGVQNQPVRNVDDFKAAVAKVDLSEGVRLEVASNTSEGVVRRFAFVQAP